MLRNLKNVSRNVVLYTPPICLSWTRETKFSWSYLSRIYNDSALLNSISELHCFSPTTEVSFSYLPVASNQHSFHTTHQVRLLEKMNNAMRKWSLPILDTATDRLEQHVSLRNGTHADLHVSREWWVDVEYQRRKNVAMPRYATKLRDKFRLDIIISM